MEEEDKIITIGTVINREEMDLIKVVFKDCGIWYFIAGEITSSVLPAHGAIGRPTIQVRKSDEGAARDLLDEFRLNNELSDEDIWKDDPEELEYFRKAEEEIERQGSKNWVAFIIVASLISLAIYYASR